MLTAARTAAEPLGRAGCAGLATSDDLEHWEIHPPALFPGDVEELECPVLEPYEDGWLLLASLAPARHIAAWAAEKITGPWEPLGPIAPPGPYAPRLIDGPDGPRLAWWPRLEDRLGPEIEDDRTVGDALIDIEIDGGLDAARHAASAPAGLRAELRDHLVVTLRGTEVAIDAPGGRLQATRTAGPPSRLRILTVGEYVEVYADDVLVLCTASYGPHTGRIRCWAVDRRSRRRPWPVRIRTLIFDDGRDDASALWRGPSFAFDHM
jgi:hypothetical protein